MPQLEQGDFRSVKDRARAISKDMAKWINEGYQIVPLIPSCSLMFKFEWPLVLPDDPDVQLLSQNTVDISEYMVNLAATEGLKDDLVPLSGSVTVHLACHSRAQNIGPKAVEMLRLIPNIELTVLERCSGHGGAWGVKKKNFNTALKVGRPLARQAIKAKTRYIVSECPLAGEHLRQGMENLGDEAHIISNVEHPIELLASSY